MDIERFKAVKNIVDEINIDRSIFIATISYAENKVEAKKFNLSISKKFFQTLQILPETTQFGANGLLTPGKEYTNKVCDEYDRKRMEIYEVIREIPEIEFINQKMRFIFLFIDKITSL